MDETIRKIEKETDPIISVIIPVHNSEKYLEECLNSVCSQTISNIEIICVDDASADGSLNILQKYAEKDSRFRIIHHEVSKGPGITRQDGTDTAKGKYIHYLDSDDSIDADAYEKILKHIPSEDIDMVIFLYRFYDDRTGQISYFPSFTTLFDRGSRTKEVNFSDHAELLIHQTVVPWNKIYRRDFLIANDLRFTDYYYDEDRFFCYCVSARAKRIILFNDWLINYRVSNTDSITKSAGKNRIPCVISVAEEIEKYFSAYDRNITQIIAEANFNQILLIYSKGSISIRQENIPLLQNYFRSHDINQIRPPFGFYPWYPQYQIITGEWENFLEIYEKIIPIVVPASNNAEKFLNNLLSVASKEMYYDIYFFEDKKPGEPVFQLPIINLPTNIHVHSINLHWEANKYKGYEKLVLSQLENLILLVPGLLLQYSKLFYVPGNCAFENGLLWGGKNKNSDLLMNSSCGTLKLKGIIVNCEKILQKKILDHFFDYCWELSLEKPYAESIFQKVYPETIKLNEISYESIKRENFLQNFYKKISRDIVYLFYKNKLTKIIYEFLIEKKLENFQTIQRKLQLFLYTHQWNIGLHFLCFVLFSDGRFKW